MCLDGLQLVQHVVVLVKHCHGKVSEVGRIGEDFLTMDRGKFKFTQM